jgi:hypothetical protein
VILLFALVLGCNDGEEESPCVHDPPLTWDNHGELFLDTYCNGCHSSMVPEPQRNEAPVGVDFDSYAGALKWASRIQARVPPDAPTMPPGGGPTYEEYVMFNEWLDCELAEDNRSLEGAE